MKIITQREKERERERKKEREREKKKIVKNLSETNSLT